MLLFTLTEASYKHLKVKVILLWYEGVKQRGVVLGEVLLLHCMLQTQKLTWHRRNHLYLPLTLKHRKENSFREERGPKNAINKTRVIQEDDSLARWGDHIEMLQIIDNTKMQSSLQFIQGRSERNGMTAGIPFQLRQWRLRRVTEPDERQKDFICSSVSGFICNHY